MIALFAHGFRAVVAAHATASDSRMIEVGTEPGGGQVAIAALEARRDVPRVLAGGLHAVVADDAEAGHRQRNLGVIDRLGGIPAHHRMAGFAHLTRRRMRSSFALRDGSVVTADAASHHFGVGEVHGGAERGGVVAGGAIVRALNMRRGLRRSVIGRARDVAHAAVSRCPLEDCVQMAGFARQVAVHAVQFETGGEVIEGHRDRRRARRRAPCRRHEQQQRDRQCRQGKQRGGSARCCARRCARRDPPRCEAMFHCY